MNSVRLLSCSVSKTLYRIVSEPATGTIKPVAPRKHLVDIFPEHYSVHVYINIHSLDHGLVNKHFHYSSLMQRVKKKN